ncbi:endonuclease/exonuclease/phosphatase family protein [Nocardioidaceae bacterium SCSIO 66511]|nr:endonuclease/exonuclease/phosphatase family protein [Nocardioidaceae bacterium SCSIO 66511]
MVLKKNSYAAAAALVSGLLLPAGAAHADADAQVAARTAHQKVSLVTYNTCLNDRCRDAYGLKSHGKRLSKIWSNVVNRKRGKKRADIVVLQETDWRVVGADGEKLVKAFPGYRIASKRDGRWILYRTAKLKKFNDGYVNVAGPSKEEKAFPWAQFASRAHPSNKVTVVDVHFASRTDKPAQAGEIRRLKQGLSDDLPLGSRTVFAGDFNILAGEPNARLFRSSFARAAGGLTDRTPKRKRTNTLKPADVPKIPYRPSSGKPIDHVYVGGGLDVMRGVRYGDEGEKRVTSKRAERKRWNKLVPKRRSDHNAVYALLRW